MILEYELTDNRLVKRNPIDFPVHLQDNVVLKFTDKDNVIKGKAYVLIKTHEAIKKVRIMKDGDSYSCELPTFVTVGTFFKIKVMCIIDGQKMVTNELIVPIRVGDYLDYNRSLAHSFSKDKRSLDGDAIYDNSMNRYDGKWKYPNIHNHVRNV